MGNDLSIMEKLLHSVPWLPHDQEFTLSWRKKQLSPDQPKTSLAKLSSSRAVVAFGAYTVRIAGKPRSWPTPEAVLRGPVDIPLVFPLVLATQ
jgi:hypothetical protein